MMTLEKTQETLQAPAAQPPSPPSPWRWTLLALAAAVPLAFDPRLADVCHLPKITLCRLAALALGAAGAAWALERRRLRLPWTPAAAAAAALLGVELASWAGSGNRSGSFWGLHGYDFEGVLQTWTFAALGLGACLSGLRARELSRALLAGGAAACAYGLAQRLGFDPLVWSADSGRVFSTMGNPNFFGTLLAVLLPPALASGLESGRRGERLAFGALALLMTVELAWTATRGAWLAAAAGVAVLALLHGRRRFAWALAVLACAAALLAGVEALARLTRSAELSSAAAPSERALALGDGSLASRLGAWKAALAIWREHPLLGAGPDAFVYEFRRHADAAYEAATHAKAGAGYAHNEYLNTLATQGLLGLAALLAFLVLLWSERGPFLSRHGLAGAGLLAGAAALLAADIVSFSTVFGRLYLWLSAGLLLGSGPGIELSLPRAVLRVPRVLPWAGAAAAALALSLPYRADLAFRAGQKLEAEGRWSQAAALYLRAEELFPPQWAYREPLAKALVELATRSGDARRRSALLEQAALRYQSLLTAYPQSASGWNGLGSTRLLQGLADGTARLGEAERCFQLAVERDPLFLDAGVNLAMLDRLAGRPDRAEARYRRLAQSYPRAAAPRLGLGRLLESLGRRDQAAKEYQAALDLDPGDAQAQAAMASLWAKL